MTDLPLAERISAPHRAIPAEVEGVEWRELRVTDADALVDLHQAIGTVDHPDWYDSREEILEELGHSYVDLAADSLAAFAEGEMVAWGLVVFPPSQETLVRSILLGGVTPSSRGRGIGRALLAWQKDRALQQLASSHKTLPGWIVAAADGRAPSAAHSLQRAGLEPKRWFQTLRRIVAEPIAASEPGGGFRVVAYTADRSEAAHAVRDAAFSGVGSSQSMSQEQWHSMMTLSTFAPHLSFLAVDGDGAVVGLLLSLLDQATAHVWVVGVHPDARRQGVARALLTRHLLAAAEARVEASALDVASDGPGEGLGLYLGLGYVPQSMSVNYVDVY